MSSTLHTKLIALKAFYMGHALTQKHLIKDQALSVIDSAINELIPKLDDKKRHFLMFLFMLKSEIMRGSTVSLELRQLAKDLASEIGSKAFEYYMTIEDATQSRKVVCGAGTGWVADKGVTQRNSRYIDHDEFYCEPTPDIPMQSLGVDFSRLSRKQISFLYQTTLKELLVRNGISIIAE